MQAFCVMKLLCSGRKKRDPIAKTLEITLNAKYKRKDWKFCCYHNTGTALTVVAAIRVGSSTEYI
jgi:hypothetical protein